MKELNGLTGMKMKHLQYSVFFGKWASDAPPRPALHSLCLYALALLALAQSKQSKPPGAMARGAEGL